MTTHTFSFVTAEQYSKKTGHKQRDTYKQKENQSLSIDSHITMSNQSVVVYTEHVQYSICSRSVFRPEKAHLVFLCFSVFP